MTAHTSFRTLLLEVLREQALTVPEAATIIGMPLPQLVAVVHGRATCTLPDASRIMGKLGVPIKIVRDVGAPP